MDAHTKTCDTRRLDLFLQDRLPDDFRQDLERHLDVCPACRDKLDELAGGARWWSELRQHLGGAGGPEVWPTCDADWPTPGSERDLQFLSPSDKPGALGKLGQYEVLEVLGWGGMGVVLRAFDPVLHRPVAIKVLAAELAAHGSARKRFAREARAAAAVSHDHVVPVHAVDPDGNPPYLVMAFIPGQSLQQRLDRSGALELKEILRIGFQTAAGLAAAHAQGLVHRDIKPANIMLENGIERVRITDFGLARAVDDASVTQNGFLAGTPQYMAPEQARGEPVDQRADLFSLGSTLYAMATGRPPFRANTTLAVIRQLCDDEPVPVRSLNPDIPAWLEGIIGKLQAKDATARFRSAAEVAELLERCLAHVQQPDRQALPPPAVELGRGSRRTLVTAASLTLPLVLGAALALSPWFSSLALSPWSWPGTRERSEAAAAGLAPEEAAQLEQELDDGWQQLRAGVDRLQGSLWAAPADAAGGVEDALQDARRQTELLQHALGSAEETNYDPLQTGLEEARRRVESLKQSVERWPDLR
jgi:serine/threonine-protein kinase